MKDGCVSPVLFCYGNPVVGKTYVRYERFLEKDNEDVADD